MTTLRRKEKHWKSRFIKEENVAGGGQFVECNEHNLTVPIKRKTAFRGTAYHLTGFLEHSDPEVSKAD